MKKISKKTRIFFNAGVAVALIASTITPVVSANGIGDGSANENGILNAPFTTTGDSAGITTINQFTPFNVSNEVTIPDSNLKAAIAAALGKNESDPIYESDMQSLTSFAAREKSISDISGLEYAINLTSLDLEKNSIVDISPLANLTKLEILYLGNNEITDLIPLKNLTSLGALTINKNKITDITPIADIGISFLAITGNQIKLYEPANFSAHQKLKQSANLLYSYSIFGEIQVTYLDETGTILNSKLVENVKAGSHSEVAPVINGYVLNDDVSKEVIISESNFTPTITFNYEKVITGTITVEYRSEDGSLLDSKVVNDVVTGIHTETAPSLTGYTLNDDTNKSVTIDKNNLSHTITFNYKKNEEPAPPSPPVILTGTVTVEYRSEDGYLLDSKIVNDVTAGIHTETAPNLTGYTLNDDINKSVTINENNLTHTITFSYKKNEEPAPPVITTGTITVEYRSDNGALLDSKVLVDVPFGQYTETAKSISGYTVKGEQTKTITLSALNKDQKIVFTYNYNTVIYPTPVPVLPTPEKPIITESHSDNAFNWILNLEKVESDYYIFKAEGLEIKIPLNDFKASKELTVTWEHVGNGHYALTLKADDKIVTKLSKSVEIKKQHPFAYLGRGKDGEYVANPYTFANNTFYIETKNIAKQFYFSDTKRSFGDINRIYSKNSIENLASRFIIFGTTENQYSPRNNITQAQLSSMIARALELEPKSSTTIASLNNHWASNDIQALSELAILKDMQISPNKNLTRSETMLILYRLLIAMDVQNLPNETPAFVDNHLIKNNAELFKAAGTLKALKIFEGDENNRLSPNANLTRAQLAKVLERVLALTNKY